MLAFVKNRALCELAFSLGHFSTPLKLFVLKVRSLWQLNNLQKRLQDLLCAVHKCFLYSRKVMGTLSKKSVCKTTDIAVYAAFYCFFTPHFQHGNGKNKISGAL